MCQFSENQILIVGGFNGKFLSDYYLFNVEDEGQLSQGQKYIRKNPSQNLFPFQVPTVGDTTRREALSIDWSTMTLYHFSGNEWSSSFSVKP